MSDADSLIAPAYEPKWVYRWRLFVENVPCWLLKSVRLCHDGPWFLARIEAYSTLDRDITERPPDNGTGVLEFLSPAGDRIDEYLLTWNGVECLPFEVLDYASSDPLVSVITLRNVTVRRNV